MDTRTGELLFLDEKQTNEAKELWQLWEAGVLEEIPQYAPVKEDKVQVKAKRQARHRKRTRTKATKSWRSFCNG